MGEKYRDEQSEEIRNEYIMELKKLVVAYSKLRDFEKGNKKYNIKLLADYLSSFLKWTLRSSLLVSRISET